MARPYKRPAILLFILVYKLKLVYILQECGDEIGSKVVSNE